MAQWRDIPLNKKLFKNVDESMLTTAYGALENCFVTESGGLSRFPGLVEVVDLGGNADVYLNRHENDLLAVGNDGRTHRINRDYEVEAIQGPPVLGGHRTTFANLKGRTIMAAGLDIIMFDGAKNTVLSPDAPQSTHVGVIDNYVLAVEAGSGRFQHSPPNEPRVWNPLDTFAVEGRADDINGLLVTPFNEILMTGEESIEQYERWPGGTAPFFRRWSVGDGVIEPYTLCFADNAAWGLNSRYEFARFSGQTSTSSSDDIGKDIEVKYAMNHLEALDKAWASPVNIKGQKFIIFQSPEAQNSYGSKGVTYGLDLRQAQWFELTGWDDKNKLPTNWPGRSIFSLWGKTFVGGQGKIYELTEKAYSNAGMPQRVYGRTAHFDDLGPMRINRLQLTLKRGVGSYSANPKIALRVNPDNKGFGGMQVRELGNAGHGEFIIEFGAQGVANTWQFEFMVTDACAVEIRRLKVDADKVVR